MNKRIVEGEKLREINQAHHDSNIAKNRGVFDRCDHSTSFTLIDLFLTTVLTFRYVLSDL